MLRNFTRLPLRRLVHTQVSSNVRRSGRYGLALGASVTAATFLAWSLASDRQPIALDAQPIASPKKVKVSPDSATTSSTVEPQSSQAHSSPLESSSPSPFVSDSDSEGTAPPSAAQPESDDEESAAGAFNPETGEINWDCPCLGGMAHGPCGPQFREAFACFVYSEDEPKGINCVEKFKAMQNCFREHPEVYGEEIMDDEEDMDGELPASQSDIHNLTAESVPSIQGEEPVSSS
ncbi:hypothetical protein SERLA73DRAFT_180084 [Serpula lacrymans var. lacrymans S7.3]|uniref:Mitochondrial intermembrane space import and assembly protein 40 n=1 Tax=Serpula lacrymans var. lacrymans (strain S7.3) TaxID=936435 RepID=F8PVM6_SERL3|nr:hypothetical protein SERLA73DRAFT_180084 [Serpula lacrymans var. lacrymans S7.3]